MNNIAKVPGHYVGTHILFEELKLYTSTAFLHTAEILEERDDERWELDPTSAEDYLERTSIFRSQLISN